MGGPQRCSARWKGPGTEDRGSVGLHLHHPQGQNQIKEGQNGSTAHGDCLGGACRTCISRGHTQPPESRNYRKNVSPALRDRFKQWHQHRAQGREIWTEKRQCLRSESWAQQQSGVPPALRLSARGWARTTCWRAVADALRLGGWSTHLCSSEDWPSLEDDRGGDVVRRGSRLVPMVELSGLETCELKFLTYVQLRDS